MTAPTSPSATEKMISYIAGRLAEPSTMAGVSAVVAAAQHHNWVGLAGGVFGVLAMILPEAK